MSQMARGEGGERTGPGESPRCKYRHEFGASQRLRFRCTGLGKAECMYKQDFHSPVERKGSECLVPL